VRVRMRIELSARSLTAIFVVVAAGCSKPVPPGTDNSARRPSPPVSPAVAPEPFKNDYSIPRELGPSGPDKYPFTGRIRVTNLEERSFPGKGPLGFVAVWNELARAAEDEKDLLSKAAFVRLTIPSRGMESTYPGGTEGLLAEIFLSDQHEVVRLAAIAALRGIHLWVASDPSRRFLIPSVRDVSHGDGCSGAVATEDSKIFPSVMDRLLKITSDAKRQSEVRMFLECCLKEGSDLPTGVETVYEALVDAIVLDPEGLWKWRQLIGKSTSPRSLGLRAEFDRR
jgi:hypothetical protein